MWPNLCRNLLLLAAPAAFAQEFLWLNAQRNWVLAGRSMAIQAVVEGEFGETLFDAPVVWATSNPAVARVSDDGVVSGLLPGSAVIEATSGMASNQFTVWVHPSRIEITPARIELEIGGKFSVSARALDADGKPLPVSNFAWRSGVPTVASIDSAGNLQAGDRAGTITISARLDIPQGNASFSGQAQVVVRTRAPFKLESIASSSGTTQVTIKAIGQIDHANDRFGFIAALSNGGSALMILDRGVPRKLIATGERGLSGAIVTSIVNPSINARGDVAARLDFASGPAAIHIYPFDKPAEPYAEYQAQSGGCCIGNSTGSLADSGEFFFGHWNGGFDEIFIGRAGTQPVKIPTDNLPVIGRGQNIRDQDAHFIGPGRLAFHAWNGGRNGIYVWDGRQITKVIAVTDSVLGRTVNWVDSRFVTSPTGDVYVRFGGPNYHAIAKWNAGAWSPVVDGYQSYGGIALRDLNWVGAANGGAVVFDAASDRGNGLFKFANGQLQRIASWGAESQHPFLWSRNMFVRSDGDVVISGPTRSAHARISRFSEGAESMIYESGRAAGFAAPLGVNWNGLNSTGSGGAIVVRTASGAVQRLEQGRATVLLSPGDALETGTFVDWIGQVATAPNGDVVAQIGVTQGNQRLYIFRGQNRIELHGPSSKIQTQAGEEVVFWFNNRIAINGEGQVAVTARIRASNGNEFDRHILINESNRQARTVFTPGAAAPGGGTFNWLDNLAVDEQGRVWFVTAATAAGSSLFVWDNGVVTKLHTQGDQMPDGRRIRAFNDLQFSNGRVFFNSWFDSSANALIETANGKLSYRLSQSDGTSLGAVSYYYNGGRFRIAPNGDIAYIVVANGQSPMVVVRKPDGSETIVGRQYERLGGSTGPWAAEFHDLAWDTNGRLFVTATTLEAVQQSALFLATPQ